MNLNNKSINKNEKRRIILDYVKGAYKKENRFVSKREIRKKFNVEIYNYFKNIFDMYQQIGIDVPLCYCPKSHARKKIIEYIKENSEKGKYPTKKEIENDLKIQIYTYFYDIKNLYKTSGVNFKLYKRRKYYLEAHFNTKEKNADNRKRITDLIRNNVKKGVYPSTEVIQNKLNLAFYRYFKNIYEAYDKAGVKYDRPCPIILGKKKEKALTSISINLLRRMGFHIKRVSIFDNFDYNNGEDIWIIDYNGNDILVEIKAYGKNKRVSAREIKQLLKYMQDKNVKKGILITTSEKVSKIKENITIIDGKNLIQLLYQFNLNSHLEEINWIQLARVNKKERIEAKIKKRKEIVRFIIENEDIYDVKTIEKSLKLDLKTYFGGRSKELIEKIRKNPNIYNARAYKAHSWKLRCTQPVYQSEHQVQPLTSLNGA